MFYFLLILTNDFYLVSEKTSVKCWYLRFLMTMAIIVLIIICFRPKDSYTRVIMNNIHKLCVGYVMCVKIVKCGTKITS